MPISWNPEPAARRTVFTVTDPYTFQEWEDAFSAMRAERACEPWRAFLVDRRQASPPSNEFIRRMTEVLASHAAQMGPARAAVVVSGEVAFGVGRMTQMTAEASNREITIRTFRTYEEAERWLHLQSHLT